MPRWRRRLFVTVTALTADAAEYFNFPRDRTVIIGSAFRSEPVCCGEHGIDRDDPHPWSTRLTRSNADRGPLGFHQASAAARLRMWVEWMFV